MNNPSPENSSKISSPEKLNRHPVFRDAMEAQLQFEGTLFDSMSDAMKYAQEVCQELDSKVVEAGLMEAPVCLSSSALYLPMKIYDTNTGIPGISSTLADVMNPDGKASVTGQFCGFGATYKSESVDGEHCIGFSADLVFMPKTGVVQEANMGGTLFAYASVVKSDINFVVDLERDSSEEILADFMDKVEDEEALELISIIDGLLRSGRYSVESLQRIGDIVQAYLDHAGPHGELLTFRDGIADLIKKRLMTEYYTRVNIESQVSFVVNKPQSITYENELGVEGDGASIATGVGFTDEVSDVNFFYNFDAEDSTLDRYHAHTLCFVFEGRNGTTIYMPLSSVSKYDPHF